MRTSRACSRGQKDTIHQEPAKKGDQEGGARRSNIQRIWWASDQWGWPRLVSRYGVCKTLQRSRSHILGYGRPWVCLGISRPSNSVSRKLTIYYNRRKWKNDKRRIR